jgi:AcrR family transcriptional regulator
MKLIHFMAYAKTSKTEAKKADTRRRILSVTRQLVSEGGFTNVQMLTVAQLAGIAIGTVYRYFHSKGDLLTELVRSLSEREVSILREIAATDGGASEKLADAVRVFASRSMKGRSVAYALIAEPMEEGVAIERLVYRRACCEVFEQIILEGIAKSEFPTQTADISAACIVGAFMEALINPLSLPGRDKLEDKALVEAVTKVCIGIAKNQENSR